MTAPVRADFYADPQVYDVLHAHGTAEEVASLRRIARAYLPRDKPRGQIQTWLEPACGSARLLIAAAKRGVRAIGFDLNKDMIAYAKQQAAKLPRPARLFTADMESFADSPHIKPHSVDLAFNLINTIRHLDSDRAMLQHLTGIAKVLRPTGLYAVGISLSAYGLESITEDTWQGRRGGLRITQVVQYLPPPAHGHDPRRAPAARAERVISHLTINRGKQESHIDSTYALRSYNLKQWHNLINRSALQITATVDSDGHPAMPSEPGYYVFILRPTGARP